MHIFFADRSVHLDQIILYLKSIYIILLYDVTVDAEESDQARGLELIMMEWCMLRSCIGRFNNL